MTAAASHAGRKLPRSIACTLETSAPRIAVGADRMVQPLSLPSGALLRPHSPDARPHRLEDQRGALAPPGNTLGRSAPAGEPRCGESAAQREI